MNFLVVIMASGIARGRVRGLKCTAHRGHVSFKLTADHVLVFRSRAHVRLTCGKQGRIGSEAC